MIPCKEYWCIWIVWHYRTMATKIWCEMLADLMAKTLLISPCLIQFQTTSTILCLHLPLSAVGIIFTTFIRFPVHWHFYQSKSRKELGRDRNGGETVVNLQYSSTYRNENMQHFIEWWIQVQANKLGWRVEVEMLAWLVH